MNLLPGKPEKAQSLGLLAGATSDLLPACESIASALGSMLDDGVSGVGYGVIRRFVPIVAGYCPPLETVSPFGIRKVM